MNIEKPILCTVLTLHFFRKSKTTPPMSIGIRGYELVSISGRSICKNPVVDLQVGRGGSMHICRVVTIWLVVATQIFFYFHPENWGTDPLLTHIFSYGLKPPTRFC